KRVPSAGNGQFAERLSGLGLSKEQVDGVLALSREVVEQVVWEVVPTLAETMIKEEIRRLTAE
ncbi:MAG: response regulator, partial [Sorangiineae bacterium PRO1]|nr:response regulator [Sorangiineae bacterium PRO1]